MMKRHYPRKPSSLRFRCFIFTLLLVGASFLLFCTIFTFSSSWLLKENSFTAAQISLNQTSIFLQEQISAFRNSMDTVALNEDCIEVLSSDLRENSGELARHLRYTTLNDAISTVLFTSHISDIFIVTDNPLASPSYGKLHPLSEAAGSPWLEHLSNTKSSFVWDTTSALPMDFSMEFSDGDYVICTRKLPYTYQTYETYICGLIPRSMFEELLNISALSPYISCYCINSADNIIFGTNQVAYEDMAVLQKWLDSQEKISSAACPVSEVAVGNRKYFAGYASVKNTDLKVIYIYAFSDDSLQNILTCIRQLGVIFLCILPFIFLFSNYISRHITKPLERLKETMLTVSDGNFDIPVLPGTKDEETNSLTKCFNYMLTKISGLLDEQYLNGQRLKDFELQALQAQINPHFLYNTLDLIKWSAVRNKDEKTQSLITALSNFYRTGLSKGEAMIPLETEISHIQSYVQIQNMRFDDCITLQQDIPEECLSCLIPKLTLQPLIENAIAHGILEAESAEGSITVCGILQDGQLILKITDNGCGMDAQTLQGLLQPPPKNAPRRSYGIYNVNERIRLFYGEKYGLHYESQPGKGTSVTIVLPDKNNTASTMPR